MPGDRKALSEFIRVLKPGGWAVIQVPMEGEQTVEDPTVTDPMVGERKFGQVDHIRKYGQDFISRLCDAGFSVRIFKKEDVLSPDELMKLSVECETEVILSRKVL